MYTYFQGISKKKVVFGGLTIDYNNKNFRKNINKLYYLFKDINILLYNTYFNFIKSKELDELIEIKHNYESILKKKLIKNEDSYYHYNQINFLLNIINEVLNIKKKNKSDFQKIQMENIYRKIASYEAKKIMESNITKEEIKFCCSKNENVDDYIKKIYDRINYVLLSSPKENETYDEYKYRLINIIEKRRDFYQNAYKNFTLEERLYEYHKFKEEIKNNLTDNNIKKINHFKKLILVKKLINIENKYIENIFNSLKEKYFLNKNNYKLKKVNIKELELIT